MVNILETFLVPVMVILTGGYFLIKTKAFFIFKPKAFVKGLKYKKDGETSPLKAMTLALAGTLGVGNIVGIGGAVALGGAGTLFWMWISTLFAMILKYSEVVIALKNKKTDIHNHHGGAMYYIKSPIFSGIFAILCLVCSLALGSSIQSGAVASCIYTTWNIPGIVGSVAISVLTFLVVLGGRKGIFNFASMLVPAMTLLYTFMCLGVIIAFRHRIPAVFGEIMSSAFDFSAIAAGGGWAAVRYGVMRGLISNEAGCGTAPIAHASTSTDSPASQGCFGIVEVFVDTILLCSLTGISILLVRPEGEDMAGIINCFSSVFGNYSGVLLTVCVVFFAFATMVCWFYYGSECLWFFFGDNKKTVSIFAVIFCLFGGIAPLISSRFLWSVADFSVAAMTVINLFAVFFKREEVVLETDKLL